MRLDTRFDMQQTVWTVVEDTVPVYVTCPTCEGNGEVPGADGRMCNCRHCNIQGKEAVGHTKSYSVRELTIGQVRVQVGYRDEETYMCTETGVGSGRVWHRKDLFAFENLAGQHMADLQQAADNLATEGGG